MFWVAALARDLASYIRAQSTNVDKGRQCAGVPLTGENALQRYDYHGLRRIRECALNSNNSGSLHQVTFLRMGSLMIDHWDSFKALVADLGGGSAMSTQDVVA
jgi:hypothetical protein